jgi:Uma2 family endonuclease
MLFFLKNVSSLSLNFNPDECMHAASELLSPQMLSTYADYKALDVDDDYWYELINGELVKKSAPSPKHQLVSMKLSSLMHIFAQEHQLGVILCAPVDVFVDETNVPQPDLLFLAQDRQHLITDDGVMGAPNLVVEILSPSSIKRDRSDQMRLYKRLGVPEYWIIDPKNESVEVYQLSEGLYDIASFAVESGAVQSLQLTGFSLNVADIFR